MVFDALDLFEELPHARCNSRLHVSGSSRIFVLARVNADECGGRTPE